MPRKKNIPSRKNNAAARKNEHGTVIALVAVFMLFVVGAMAALSIDAVTIYTARSEAQLVADAAALAGARVLANSGLTSTNNNPSPNGAETLATAVATQVATQNDVGGRTLISGGTCPGGEICVSFNDGALNFATDPHITVTVQRNDLPTFFARIWGRAQAAVTASATAEAYNPSNATGTSATTSLPVAPLCVKPWLLPNIDPTQTTLTKAIFDATGAITDATLVGQTWPNATNTNGIYSLCNGGDCSAGNGGISAPAPGAYYPGLIGPNDFPAPASGPPGCSANFNSYQLAVAGCVQRPIACGAPQNSSINIDTGPYAAINGSRDADTVPAAECLIHQVSTAGDSDSVVSSPPFQFLGGNQNPIAKAIGQDVLVSDSLVTIPVINNPPGTPANPVQVIGFLQVFLNPSATSTLPYATGLASAYEIPAMIINMAGCGAGNAGQPILGNGASPVAVRLISGP